MDSRLTRVEQWMKGTGWVGDLAADLTGNGTGYTGTTGATRSKKIAVPVVDRQCCVVDGSIIRFHSSWLLLISYLPLK